MSWEQIEEHRIKARQVYFDILVWGPSVEDGAGHKLRRAIRDHLTDKGHSAKFSEEFTNEGRPAPDPIVDEYFQVDAAHLVVVLYGSRGTQTEVDVLLESEDFARKSIILLSEEIYSRIMKSLSAYKWKNFKGEVLLIPDGKCDIASILHVLDDQVEKLQFAEYYRRLRRARLQ